jgi:hypothetical protein
MCKVDKERGSGPLMRWTLKVVAKGRQLLVLVLLSSENGGLASSAVERIDLERFVRLVVLRKGQLIKERTAAVGAYSLGRAGRRDQRIVGC